MDCIFDSAFADTHRPDRAACAMPLPNFKFLRLAAMNLLNSGIFFRRNIRSMRTEDIKGQPQLRVWVDRAPVDHRLRSLTKSCFEALLTVKYNSESRSLAIHGYTKKRKYRLIAIRLFGHCTKNTDDVRKTCSNVFVCFSKCILFKSADTKR